MSIVILDEFIKPIFMSNLAPSTSPEYCCVITIHFQYNKYIRFISMLSNSLSFSITSLIKNSLTYYGRYNRFFNSPDLILIFFKYFFINLRNFPRDNIKIKSLDCFLIIFTHTSSHMRILNHVFYIIRKFNTVIQIM